MKTFDHLNVIGLREWIGLPELGIDKVRVKVDSGARTSALHASDIETFVRDGETWVRFNAHTGTLRKHQDSPCEARLVSYKRIKSSNGQIEERHVIRTPMVLGDQCWAVDFTLTCRKSMRYRLLLGSKALIDGQLVVNPEFKYVQDKPVFPVTTTSATGVA